MNIGEIIDNEQGELSIRKYITIAFESELHAFSLKKTEEIVKKATSDLTCFEPFAAYFVNNYCVRIPYFVQK